VVTARRRRGVFVVAALIAILAATITFASAKTYSHGRTVWFSDVTIDASDDIRGDLDIVYGNVTCGDGATIGGSVRTFFGSFEQRDGCSVGGRVVDAFGGESLDAYVPWSGTGSGDFMAQNRGLLNKFAWDVVVVLAFLLFPLRARIALDRVERHPGLSAATGAVTLVAAIPVAVLLLLSIIGLPLIPLEIAALFGGLWIGFAAVALLIGRRLYEVIWPHTTPTPFTALALGLVVVTAAQTLPVVGWAVTALVGFVGLGAALLAFVRETSFRSFTRGVTNASASPPSSPPANRPA
jgi:hypothetical protein